MGTGVPTCAVGPVAGASAVTSPGLRARLDSEEGSGPVTAWGAMIMLLLFIFLTVQTTMHLYAVSQASSIALEAASRVARGDETCASVADWIDGHIGHWDDVSGGCVGAPGTTVTIEIVGDSPAPALRGFGFVTNKATLDREATMRMETFQ